jgi:hypothetical protein
MRPEEATNLRATDVLQRHGYMVLQVRGGKTAPRAFDRRMAIANGKVRHLLRQISTEMARAGLNIDNMLTRAANGIYAGRRRWPGARAVATALTAVNGVLSLRYRDALASLSRR